MRLVFVNRFFHPDLSATSQMLSDLAFGLAAKGHEVHVVASRQLYEDAGAQLPRVETVQGVYIHRAWSTQYGRAKLLGRAMDYLSFYLGATYALYRVVEPGSILVAKTDPPLISVPAAWVARARGAKLVNWLQDVFPEVAQATGMRWAGGLVGRWAQRLRDGSLSQAACNVVIGERMQELLVRRGLQATSLPVVPNWSDPALVQPIDPADNPLLDQWGLRDKFVVMYSGNMGRAHEFGTILAAAAQLSADPRIVFVFVGGGARKPAVMAQVQQQGLNNVRFLPYQPKETLAQSLSAGAVHLISLMPEQEGLIVPSKFYGVLAAGRPTVFVGDTDGEIARLVKRHGVGVALAIGDGRGLSEALLRLAEDEALRRNAGIQARVLLLQQFAVQQGCASWERLLLAVGK